MVDKFPFPIASAAVSNTRTIKVLLEKPLADVRSRVLKEARQACPEVEPRLVDHAFVASNWREMLDHLEPLRYHQGGVKFCREEITLDLALIWELDEYMRSLMLKGAPGALRLIYAHAGQRLGML